MQYIANVSGGASSQIQEVKDMVLATNPLLESFGCAKTLRNNNSSRHGKYLEIQFNAQGEPVGANITNYLLEKGRVVGQILNERNFHIFYQYTKAAPPDYRGTQPQNIVYLHFLDRFGVQPPESYLYTSRSKCYNADGIDDHADFANTLRAMATIGLSQQEIDDIFKVLAAILWLGNVQFAENNEGNAAVADEGVATYIGYLLDVDGASVTKVSSLQASAYF
jgi:myosin I